jgi:hypothetical protein
MRRVRRREGHERLTPAVESPVPEHALLALQRQIGNQAVQRLILARDAKTPSRLGVPYPTDLYGGSSAEKWGDDVRNAEYLKLYSELATLLQATAIEDVKGTAATDINTARKPTGTDLKPGLNLVGDLGSDRGQTGYLYDGQFNSKLPAVREGPLPSVAVCVGPRAFDAGNKASTLGVLRHELEHAFHNRLALNWLKAWRADGKAAKQSFAGWLEKQSMAPADRALVKERIDGTRINTEALGNLEGFIAAFPFATAETEKGSHATYFELEDTAEYWVNCDKAVQQEVIARLKSLRARLTADQQTAFDVQMKKLRAAKKAYVPLADAVTK